MRYYFNLLIMFSLSSQLYAQDKIPAQLAETKKEIQPYFDKISPREYPELVPFYENGLWGYLNEKTLKIVVPPFANLLNFYGEVPEFMGNSFKGSLKGYLLNIENGKIQMNYTDLDKTMSPPSINVFPDAPPKMVRKSFAGTKVKSSADGFKGFEYKIINGQYILTAYSDLYKSKTQNNPDIIDLVLDEQPYLIVQKDYLYGIIDSTGKPLKGFDFKFKSIKPLQLPGKHLKQWFLVSEEIDGKETYSLLSQKGEHKFQNQLDVRFDGLAMMDEKTYPCYIIKRQIAGYVVVNGSLYDLINLEKPISLDKEQFITSVKVIDHEENFEDSSIENLRKNAKIYVLVQEGEKMYYMDLKGKKYLPK